MQIKIENFSHAGIMAIMKEEIEKNEYIFVKTLPVFTDIHTDHREYDESIKSHYKYLYLTKYFYKINEVLLAFNAYLVEKYINLNENPDEEWENIYEPYNKINKITYLTYFLLNLTEISKSETIEILYKMYLYENLFRHQISHGWIEIFTNTKYINSEILLDLSNVENINLKTLRKDSKINNFDDSPLIKLRKLLKKDKNFDSSKMYDFLQIVSPIVSSTEIKEPVIKIKINNKKILNLKKEELKTEMELDEKIINFLLKNINQELKNEYNIWHLSLNYLIKDILIVVRALKDLK